MAPAHVFPLPAATYVPSAHTEHPLVVPALAEYTTVPSYPAAQVHDPAVPVYPVAVHGMDTHEEAPANE